MILILIADPLGVVESDVVRRVAIHDVRQVAVHELLHKLLIGGVADKEAVLAEFPDLSGFHLWCDRLLERLLDIKVVIDHVNVVKEVLKLLVAEADIKEHAHIELLEKLFVPRAGVLVEAEIEFSLLVECQFP